MINEQQITNAFQILQLQNTNASNNILIAQLMLQIKSLKEENEELKKDKTKYYEIIEENKKLIVEHENNIRKLEMENIELQNKIKSLEKHIEHQDNKILSFEKHISVQDKRISVLETNIKDLQDRDDPLTIREGFVSLEKYILMEILGSKNKAREFCGVKDLFKSSIYKTECDDFLKKYNITIDHINFISEIKKCGNKSAHIRPIITRNDFEDVATTFFCR